VCRPGSTDASEAFWATFRASAAHSVGVDRGGVRGGRLSGYHGQIRTAVYRRDVRPAGRRRSQGAWLGRLDRGDVWGELPAVPPFRWERSGHRRFGGWPRRFGGGRRTSGEGPCRFGGGRRTSGGTSRRFGGGHRTSGGTSRRFGEGCRTFGGTSRRFGGVRRTFGESVRRFRWQPRNVRWDLPPVRWSPPNVR
jgi:hypothetical protein